MRRIGLTVFVGLVVLAVMAVLPAASFAIAGKTDVSGTVSNNGTPVKKAQVTVTCNGITKNTKTNASGAYLVQFSIKKAPANSPVTVTASKGSLSGSATGKVVGDTAALNVAIVNVSVLPELGAGAAIAAAVVACGGFFFIRRRKLAVH